MVQTLLSALQLLIGEQLSAVTFVQDYWQLDFDGSGFTVFSGITVIGQGWVVRDGEEAFRNRLCERIAHLVTSAKMTDDAVVLSLDDGCTISMSLQHASGPEALIFRLFGQPGNWWVV